MGPARGAGCRLPGGGRLQIGDWTECREKVGFREQPATDHNEEGVVNRKAQLIRQAQASIERQTRNWEYRDRRLQEVAILVVRGAPRDVVARALAELED